MCVQVIEVFIRSEEGLSRDMVKHLNVIEEQVLESRAWTKDSVLWEALNNNNSKVPTVAEVWIYKSLYFSMQCSNIYNGYNCAFSPSILQVVYYEKSFVFFASVIVHNY